MGSQLYLGQTPLQPTERPVSGAYLTLAGEQFYQISNYDSMRPFFMTLVSDSDHWLFISSHGGLTAGRKNPAHALFPYYTDDKLTALSGQVGSRTLLRVEKDGRAQLWEPFSQAYRGLYELSRNLYKNRLGNTLLFEETNHSLGLTFRYRWQFSEQYGFVKRAELINNGTSRQELRILDGLQQVLPYGISTVMQNERSNLCLAYRKSELDESTGLGLFLLSAMIVDKAEPSEALRATTVWSEGLAPAHYLLSSRQLARFRAGQALETETEVRAEAGSYFIEAPLSLAAGATASWYLVSEIEQDHTAVVGLIDQLQSDPEALIEALEADIARGSEVLRRLVGMADGLQLTGDEMSVGRHYSNVLFNIMRGGIFEDQYQIDQADLLDYVQTVSPQLLSQQAPFFESLPATVDYPSLLAAAGATQAPDLIRICYEYLPLSFSRRHGDPSRPWNKFSIENKKRDGSKNRAYQGNWRDIFQNWEALAYSFPGFINAMITKFVNASTIDGYNPYRITREGIDWEVIEPEDPWSYIGYWGDHQIIYLLKLLEVSLAHNQAALQELLEQAHFVYANVPYRIKAYHEILRDPQDTIEFDEALNQQIEARCQTNGADGKLVYGADGSLVRATLTEKLLLSLLTKLSNFVPEAGIWLNTQRPEWNDANNALVGNGVSMVTLCYLRRYLTFCQALIGQAGLGQVTLNEPVARLLEGIEATLAAHQEKTQNRFSDAERKQLLDELGTQGEAYRSQAYQGFNGQQTRLSEERLLAFFSLALKYVDHTIGLNQRPDGLYHAYNLLTIGEEEVAVSYLYEMLEGQVAAMSSGLLDGQACLALLDALKQSPIYRADQYSYLLYPNRQLPRFLEKNRLPADFVAQSPLAQALLAAGDHSLLSQDVRGEVHFSGDFHHAQDLAQTLHQLAAAGYEQEVAAEFEAYLAVFEQMFDHKSFTGRSGTMFGYEGLGSIYWHMVSKLLLATQEAIYATPPEQTAVRGRLIDHYYEIRAGIGINKSPDLYGAFPTDPYSHTPAHKGAQQPGMTGQVKEDVLNRWAELGVRVEQGRLAFAPVFLSPKEFLTEPGTFSYFDLAGRAQSLPLQAGELGFTYCQVPVVYQRSHRNCVHLTEANETRTLDGLRLGAAESAHVFARDGHLRQIRVELKA